MHKRLLAIASQRLASPIAFSVWSPRIDVLALSYSNSPNAIELRRMDWTKVNSIQLPSHVLLFCFDSNGRNLCAATDDNKLSLYSIENSQLLSSISFESEIVSVCFGKYKDIDITAVGCGDSFLYVLSDFHFLLCKIELPFPAIKLTIDDELNLFAVLEDYTTISHFKLAFIESNYQIIQIASKNLSEYWNNHQIIENQMTLIGESWKRVWYEAKQFSANKEEIVRAFLIGLTPPEISTQTHRSRVHKTIIHELETIQNGITDMIIPSFLKMDQSSQNLKRNIDFSPDIGIQVDSVESTNQMKNCISVLKNVKKLKNCFDTLFNYLENPESPFKHLEASSITSAQFTEFLIKYFEMFDLFDLQLENSPKTSPVFEAIHVKDITISSPISSMCGKWCCCIGECVQLISMESNQTVEYFLEGVPLSAYAFDENSVGCFFNQNNKIMFKMLDEEDGPYEVPLIGASHFIFSPRNIAFVSSNDLFCSVIDLVPDEEQKEN